MRIGRLAGKQVLGAIVAAVLLTVIFVPFQPVEAVSVDFASDGDPLAGDTIPKSAGMPITMEITLAPSEFLDKDLLVIISPGLPNAGDEEGTIDLVLETFTATPATGTPDSLLKDINVVVDTTSYGYGYGYASASGFTGPMIITIDAILKTSFLHQSGGAIAQTLTLDAGCAVAADCEVTFNIGPSNSVATESASGGTPKTVTTGNGKTITITPGSGSGTVVVAEQTVNDLPQVIASGGTAIISVGTNTNLQTIGDPLEIDVEGLQPPYVITITYDPSQLPSGVSENDVRFLHFNEDTGEWEDRTISRNPGLNTVTGSLPSLSPVVAAADPDDAATPSTGGGGGGNRGPVVVSWPEIQTLPESHFALFPLDRIQVSNSVFLNALGGVIQEGQVDQQISIGGTFTNYQEVGQNYAFIVQVTDENGFATSIDWQESLIQSGQTTDISVLWTPDQAGVYDIQIFVWDGISETPQPLSSVTVKTIRITE